MEENMELGRLWAREAAILARIKLLDSELREVRMERKAVETVKGKRKWE